MRLGLSTLRAAVTCGAALAALVSLLAGADAASPEAAAGGGETQGGVGRPSEPATSAKPISLEELLQQVRAAWDAETRENKRREEAFEAAKREQQRLLEQAKATRTREAERSEHHERQFEKNEGRIAELENLREQRLGNLGELFGVVRQVAGDTRSHVEDSLISAQLPNRETFLRELGKSKALPSLESLQRLWYTLQQEMTEQGKVTRFHTTIVSDTGQELEDEVIRVGPFTAVANGKYLSWNSEVQKLVGLGGEPPRRYQKTVQRLEAATSGPVRFAVDPGRGSVLAMLVQTPSLEEQIDAGGLIGYAIILLGSATCVIAVARLIYVFSVSRTVRAQAKRGRGSHGDPLGRIFMVYEENKRADTETLELKLDEAILRETARAERFSWLIRVVAAVAPLMGLLGTVTGMIKTFQMITLFGTGDPKIMASGISEALVTTMLGLCVAIPLLLLYGWLSSISKGIVDVLEEQSAGLIAAQAEGSSEVLAE